MGNDYIIITNNPLVYERLADSRNLIYKEISFEAILQEARDKIHQGHTLLSHPLSGSVKPNETPYKSVMIGRKKGNVDQWSVSIIENALQACGKFQFRSDSYEPQVYEDFQLIDWTLLESAMSSADAW